MSLITTINNFSNWLESILFAFLSGISKMGKTDPLNPGGSLDPPKVNLVQLNFCGKTISVNYSYKIKFVAAAEQIANMGLCQNVTRVDSYNPRYIANTTIWSYHAYGQAIDINPSMFPDKPDPYNLPAWFINLAQVMRAHGFRWGGKFQNYFDPMHFEIGTRGS